MGRLILTHGFDPQIVEWRFGRAPSLQRCFFVLHLGGDARIWKSVFQDVQAILNILELIAVVSLFEDLVVRFDQITRSFQVPRVVGVGLCVTGLLFKWFVLYLHLSYLVD